MDIDDLKKQISGRFENAPIQSSAFYADPEDHLDNQKKLRVTLKSFTETQKMITPFALQILCTHSEITLMPLGLLDLNELKQWENEQRKDTGILVGNPDKRNGFPLVIQFESHVKEFPSEKKVLDVYTDDLFNHFHDTFNDHIWPIVMKYLNENQSILKEIEKKLVDESSDVKNMTLKQLEPLNESEIKEKIGISLKKDQLEHYSSYIADMSQVNSILTSSGTFTKEQILKDMPFAQMMNLAEMRNTFFYVLDNTFNEILYFYIQAYGTKNPALKKHLQTLRKNLAAIMRQDAWKKSNDLIEDEKKFDAQKFFSSVFLPIAENLEVEIDKFK
ncbi:hypothetical protein [Companilactobacillus hulinensis]|uniref:hypothetical protein n=1 Tax=Companilactobacillus hulinensis TaxID=2486007 RepID=UPI000F7AC2B7|nr:hypothetical protein [Companilactobacillus hulinensis]